MSNETETTQEIFNIQDVANLVQIIDYAANQGAFKGWETIKQVMAVRDKAAIFVELSQAQAQAQAETEAQGPDA